MSAVEIGAGGDATTHIGLPPGVHPHDRSGVELPPVPTSFEGAAQRRGRAPFTVGNGSAVPVYQRASLEHAEAAYTVSQTQQIAGRRPGRSSVTIWVPSTTAVPSATAIQWNRLRAYIDAGAGLVLAPGDSVTIISEAPVYAGPTTAGTAAGPVYIKDEFNTDTIQDD